MLRTGALFVCYCVCHEPGFAQETLAPSATPANPTAGLGDSAKSSRLFEFHKRPTLDRLNDAVRSNPDVASNYFARAAYLLGVRNYRDAIPDFQEVLRRNPQDLQALLGLGRCQTGTSSFDDAIESFSRAIGVDSRSSDAFALRGRCHWELKNYDQALANAGEALNLDPHNPTAHLVRAHVHAAREDFVAAINDMGHVVDLPDDEHEEYARAYRATWMEKLAKHEDALAEYDALIRIDPCESNHYVRRCRCLVELKRFDAALVDAEVLVDYKPKSPAAYGLRGWVHEYAGNYNKAKADFLTALKYDPRDLFSIDSLAYLLTVRGEKSVHDPQLAIAYATQACTLTGWKSARELGLLVMSYAGAGNFESAAKWQEVLSTIATREETEKCENFIALMKARRR